MSNTHVPLYRGLTISPRVDDTYTFTVLEIDKNYFYINWLIQSTLDGHVGRCNKFDLWIATKSGKLIDGEPNVFARKVEGK